MICAVVVTYNRRPLLERLVGRLRELEEFTEILVIDNASTDGTGEWLAREASPEGSPRLLGRVLERNTGGAGGFRAGLEWALERGADRIWLMDDDGLPDLDCLRLLLGHGDEFDFSGPLVVDEDDPERLVFPIRLPGSARVVHTVAEVDAAVARAGSPGVLSDVVIPFNGVLLTRELVERIGLVRADYFIWGDDHEYRFRAERAGARIATITDARVRHPSVGELGTPMAFGRTTYNHSPSDLKHYCMARNNLLNLREYKGPLHAAAFVAKTAWFYTFTRRDLGRLRLSARAMRDGLRGDFTGHERFLS